MENHKKALNLLYGGSIILGGTIAGIWAFTAKKFLISECFTIACAGMLAGFGLGCLLNGMTLLMQNKK